MGALAGLVGLIVTCRKTVRTVRGPRTVPRRRGSKIKGIFVSVFGVAISIGLFFGAGSAVHELNQAYDYRLGNNAPEIIGVLAGLVGLTVTCLKTFRTVHGR
jgi:hypothetical protein